MKKLDIKNIPLKKIKIWTFTSCPFCVRVKRLFDKLDIPYTEHVIAYGDPHLKVLEAKTACDTLPQVFADDEFIGDCTKLYDLYRQGELLDLIRG